MPTSPHTTVTTANWRTTLSLYTPAVEDVVIVIGVIFRREGRIAIQCALNANVAPRAVRIRALTTRLGKHRSCLDARIRLWSRELCGSNSIVARVATRRDMVG